MLLVKTRLGISSIHGIGLFADELIPKGTVTWRFMNHSADPNIVALPGDTSRYGVDVANRDIQPGEELTCDYGGFDPAVALTLVRG